MQETDRSALSGEAAVSSPLSEKVLLLYLPFAFICLVLGTLIAITYHGWTEAAIYVVTLVEEDQNSPVAQAVILVSLIAVMLVCCLPGPAFLMILVGFIFGLWVGLWVNFLAEASGFLMSLLLGRTCLQGRLRRWITQNSMMKEAVEVCEQGQTGYFLVLFRFLPLPIWAKNYAMAELDVSIARCCLAFIPAALYMSTVFAYIGSRSYDAANELRAGKKPSVGSYKELCLISVSILATILILLLGKREFQRRREALGRQDE